MTMHGLWSLCSITLLICSNPNDLASILRILFSCIFECFSSFIFQFHSSVLCFYYISVLHLFKPSCIWCFCSVLKCSVWSCDAVFLVSTTIKVNRMGFIDYWQMWFIWKPHIILYVIPFTVHYSPVNGQQQHTYIQFSIIITFIIGNMKQEASKVAPLK